MTTLTADDLWIDLTQGTTDSGSKGIEHAFGYVGTHKTYQGNDGESIEYDGWFFSWPDARPAAELTDAEIDGMVASLEREKTETNRDAIPLAVAEEFLRANIEPRKVVITIYWDDQDRNNEGWAARKIGPRGEDTTALVAKNDLAAKIEAAKHYGVDVGSVEVA